jgi:hypothetical protein
LHAHLWKTRAAVGDLRRAEERFADAIDFLGAPTKTKSAESTDQEKPADRPAVGAYRR